MTTSGTVATTSIDTSAVIEHAFRRCKILPSAQTPETVLLAKECLYMLLLNMSNRGLNLWCVEKAFIGLDAGVKTYITDPGTLDVLNALYSQPTLSTTSFSATATGGNATLSSPAVNVRIGVKFSATYNGQLTISSSQDGIVFATDSNITSFSYSANKYYWFDLTNTSARLAYSVDGLVTSPPSIADIVVASAIYDLPMTQWNRDTYAAINAKNQPGRPSTSYFYEKKLTPSITLWPVPNNNYDHLTIYRHRQPQDVGSLTQTLEIPQRWLDGFIWLLAARICFELPNVSPETCSLVVGMADKQELEMEQSETDGAPIYLTPNTRCYTA